MNKEDLYGYVPAIATPFNATGEIMEDAFVELFEFLIKRGATTICVAGDNGESWALNAEERGRLVRLAKDTAKDRVKVMMGISAPTIDASLACPRSGRKRRGCAAVNAADLCSQSLRGRVDGPVR